MMVSPEQNEAIICPGHCSIIAPPGSGKTRTLVAKAVALINAGHTKIQLISFTNASAKEIETRVLASLSPHLHFNVKVGTFHAVLLNHLSLHGVSNGFVTPQQQSSMMHQAWSTIESTGDYFRQFEEYVQQRLLWEQKPENLSGVVEESEDADIYELSFLAYRQLVLNSQQVTLDNLISHCVDLMVSGKLPLLDARVMMVDEFQDCDSHQTKLVLIHGLNNTTVTTVSDDDQSIYSFRASLGTKAILTLEKALNAKRIILSTNYRSYSEILTTAYKLVERISSRIPKVVTAHRGEGALVKLLQLSTPHDEAVFISNEIQAAPTIETFIIARTNAYLSYIEVELKAREIPFKKQQSKGYFDNSICHLAMSASISLFQNKGSELNNLLQVLAGTDNSIKRAQALNHAQENPSYTLKLNLALSSIRASHQQFSNGNGAAAIKLFFNGIIDRLTELNYSDATRLYQLSETLNKMKAPSLEAKIRLLTSPPQERCKDAKVTLMTMHGSKGLEAPRVFVAGVNEKVIPSSRTLTEAGLTGKYQECIDEEARLVFVAVTRAEDSVYITVAKGTEQQPNRYGPSQIISPLL